MATDAARDLVPQRGQGHPTAHWLPTRHRLSYSAIRLPPSRHRSGAPEPIRETFTIDGRVYELRVAPRPLTRESRDAVLAEAIGQVLLTVSYNENRLARTDRPSLEEPLLLDFVEDDLPYQVRVERLQGEPLLWASHEDMDLLFDTLLALIPEGYEYVWTRWLTE